MFSFAPFAGAGCRSLDQSGAPGTSQLLIFTDKAARLSAGSLEGPCGTACYRLFPIFTVRRYYLTSQQTRSGGDGGIRTPGLRRAKAALSQLSYIPRTVWSEWAFQGSNLRPRPYQRRALTS
jgi:hypothetical protein